MKIMDYGNANKSDGSDPLISYHKNIHRHELIFQNYRVRYNAMSPLLYPNKKNTTSQQLQPIATKITHNLKIIDGQN